MKITLNTFVPMNSNNQCFNVETELPRDEFFCVLQSNC